VKNAGKYGCKMGLEVWGDEFGGRMAREHVEVVGFLERENLGLGFGEMKLQEWGREKGENNGRLR